MLAMAEEADLRIHTVRQLLASLHRKWSAIKKPQSNNSARFRKQSQSLTRSQHRVVVRHVWCVAMGASTASDMTYCRCSLPTAIAPRPNAIAADLATSSACQYMLEDQRSNQVPYLQVLQVFTALSAILGGIAVVGSGDLCSILTLILEHGGPEYQCGDVVWCGE